jgi:hypothetical protein
MRSLGLYARTRPLIRPQRLLNRRFERGQIVLHGLPDGIQLDAVILMPQSVADPTNVRPSRAGTEVLRLFAQSNGGFADYLQLAFELAIHVIPSEARNLALKIKDLRDFSLRSE